MDFSSVLSVQFLTIICGFMLIMFIITHCSNITFYAVDALCPVARNKMTLISGF